MTARDVKRFVPIGAAILAAALAACTGAPEGSPVPDKVHEQAQLALSHWADGVKAVGPGKLVFPVGELTGQIGNWEERVGDNNKQALYAGRVVTRAPLPGAAGDGQVTWPDGTTTDVPVMSAQDAIVAIAKTVEAPCDSCTDLIATSATLIDATIQTSRGPAKGPVWPFAIEGTGVSVTRVAIANAVTVPVLPSDPSFASVGMHIDSALGSAAATEVTVAFVGAPDPGGQPCGEDYTAEAVESELAVVVIVTRHQSINLFGGGCSAVGARRTATVTLKAPLRDRVLLNVDDGQPVPMAVAS